MAITARHAPAWGWQLWLLGLVLAWAPLPLASNRVWALAGLSMVLVALLTLALGLWALGRAAPMPPWRAAWLPGGLLLLYAALLWVQTGAWGGAPLSVDAHHTWQALLQSVGYISAFFLVMVWVTPGEGVLRLVRWLVVLGFGQALLACLLYSLQASYALYHFDFNHATRTLGTFTYHNSLANYLLIGIGLAIGLLLRGAESAPRQGPRRHWQQRLRGVLTFALSAAMRWRLMLVVMVMALVLTKSRMGNAAFVAVLLLVLLPVLAWTQRLRAKGLLLLCSIILVDVLIIGQLIGLDHVAERLNQTGLEQPEGVHEESLDLRSGPAQQAWQMVQERPWLGRGAGTFYTSFPQYAGSDIRQYYDHAHNDYMQFLVEVGGVGLGALALAVLATLWHLAAVLRRPYSASDRGLAVGFLMAMVAVLIQALVDFHFQIPANALLFVVVLALAWKLRLHPPPAPNLR